MREEYITELIREIRGPRFGPNEILTSNPYSEYVTGVIIPKSCKKMILTPDSEEIRSENDDLPYDDGERGSDQLLSIPSELDPQMKPKSFGISFILEGREPGLSVCLSWARYMLVIEDNPSTENLKDKENQKWKRIPFLNTLNIPFSNLKNSEIPIYEQEDGKVLLNLRVIAVNTTSRHIIVSLINDLKTENCWGDTITQKSLFQPSIRIILEDGGALIAPEQKILSEAEYIYKDCPVLVRGHMCSAVWKDIEYQERFNPHIIWPECEYSDESRKFLACDLRSEFNPIHPAPAPEFEWNALETESSPDFSARNLSELWNEDEIRKSLSPLIINYRAWINEQEFKLNSGVHEDLPEGRKILKKQKQTLNRLEIGLNCVLRSEKARIAFCFANRVIMLQNLWKNHKKAVDTELDFLWRPFQLAFFLASLESLYNRDSDYRDTMDLLWVPTGGGKTEAYLAMMAFVISLRRMEATTGIRGDHYDRCGAGVSVITRYTLRLLTVQQFRRTLLMTMAAEYLRVFEKEGLHGWRPEGCPVDDDWLYGTIRFSTGMWVGGGVSPNHLRGEYGAINALLSETVKGEPAQIVKCPVCGSWLSIPRAGLSEGKNTIHVIISTKHDSFAVKEKISGFNLPDFVSSVEIVADDLPENYLNLKINTKSNSKLQDKQFDEFVHQLEEWGEFVIASFRPSRPGYFPVPPEPSRRTNKYPDFDIFCNNPECDLNSIREWKEATPFPNKMPTGTNGTYFRIFHGPFSKGNRMPLPAYTTDEQIYHRCPTIIVSTADKIARLAFEPRAGSMFGAVKRYNRLYGYLRGNEKEFLPTETIQGALNSEYNIEIQPFLPPDLIVQDELHLMEGPLGSMFGLYESVVDGLIKHAGGRPKYVASSATVNKAETQVKQLFRRETFLFPPNGLTYRDSLFVRYPKLDVVWDEKRPGRVYLGVYAPGMAALTPLIRIWSRHLQTGQNNQDNEYITNFWTLVGYFNSIRELGGNRSLYREDIVERVSQIAEGSPRTLDAEKVIELSSRVDSTDIPQILEDLEQGGNRDPVDNPDAIFTTSMFGTGVDIPHLSLMIVNGQPKTTSQYIQATGRVGREHGALVTVFYKAGRPRDLSHYELFAGYHNRINLMVEPASVAPFSEGCLERAAGPAMVAFLRNMVDAMNSWAPNDGHLVQNTQAKQDFNEFLRSCLEGRGRLPKHVSDFMKSQFDLWVAKSSEIGKQVPLKFNEYSQYTKAENHVVLGDPPHERREGVVTVFRNAPQSLRDVEETTGFEV
ncbi:MAG: DNA/RNA helicase [Desulfuromonas sp. SDB]|nr:MAG: DNA/RNA helicase [Desulfuromonas sp. SDB]